MDSTSQKRAYFAVKPPHPVIVEVTIWNSPKLQTYLILGKIQFYVIKIEPPPPTTDVVYSMMSLNDDKL